MAYLTYSSNLAKVGYLPEAAFGTPNADSSNFKELNVPRGVFINPMVVTTDLDNNRSTRVQLLDDIHVDAVSGPVEMKIPELIMSIDRAADMLYACMQNKVSEGAVGTAYSKVLKMHASQPDFTANAGYFFTLAFKSPITGLDQVVTSCIVKEIELDFDKTGKKNEAIVRFKNILIYGKKCTPNKTLTGTWVAQGTTYFYASTFTITGAASIPWTKFSLKLDNGAKPLDMDSDGTPKTWQLDPPKMGIVTAHIETWYNDDMTGVILNVEAAHTLGSKLNFIVSTGTVDTTGYLNISIWGIIKGDSNPKGNTSNLISIPIDLICGNTLTAGGGGTPTDAVTITLADNIDQTP